MPISDRTRKLLWGNSGNRCAICRKLLSAPATSRDPSAVLGEECHIIAQSSSGPRAEEISAELLDSEANLILLCRDDHRRVDAQPNHYSAAKLQSIKIAHEAWVHSTLDNRPLTLHQLRFRRVGPKLDTVPLIASGAEILSLAMQASASDLANDELETEEEVEVIGSFLQTLHDYVENGDDLEPA